ncbi:MAG: N-acetylmuramoyl-L-alanine amidase [Coriobacteriia bacterium]|nr:N-acetylmuramoyl-L-alanine amidase [Coriobacteriia bacterium]
MSAVITQGPQAAHDSGIRPLSAIAYGVIHVTECADPIDGAEDVASYFAQEQSGGSTQYVIDNDSIVQTLPDDRIAWGAPPLNYSGIHIEQSGYSDFTREQWLATYLPQIDNTAWNMARLSRLYDIPLRWLTAADLVAIGTNPAKGSGGWTGHQEVSAAWHQTDHGDPGDGYPVDVLMAKAHFYANGGDAVYEIAPAGWLRFYRLKDGRGDYLLTSSVDEAKRSGYDYEGIAFDVALTKTNTLPLYRLVVNGFHFYTASESEKNQLVSTGAVNEGMIASVGASGTMVKRLVNGSLHLWTTSNDEAATAASNGWSYEGFAFGCGVIQVEASPTWKITKQTATHVEIDLS